MRAGIASLALAYFLSQFYRAFLAVLAPVLERDAGAGADDLANASSAWFLTFAAMQIPVGASLDRFGPRLTAAALLTFGGGFGAALFAWATTPPQIIAAMALIGAGCAPVLMASFYIFAKSFPPARFATMAALLLGTGTIGNIAAALPLTLAVEAFGWRSTVFILACVTTLAGAAILATVKDPIRDASPDNRGSVLDLFRIPALWVVMIMLFVDYAPIIGIRGLWIGPYLKEAHGATETLIGNATLAMGLAMVAGSFAVGPLDRIFGTRKWVIIAAHVLVAAVLAALIGFGGSDVGTAIALFALIGLFGSTFPMIMAHGRAFLPPQLIGRGVTLLNLFAIGGVGVMQFVTGRLYAANAGGGAPIDGHLSVFWLFFAITLIGIIVYLFVPDRTD